MAAKKNDDKDKDQDQDQDKDKDQDQDKDKDKDQDKPENKGNDEVLKVLKEVKDLLCQDQSKNKDQQKAKEVPIPKKPITNEDLKDKDQDQDQPPVKESLIKQILKAIW